MLACGEGARACQKTLISDSMSALRVGKYVSQNVMTPALKFLFYLCF